MNLKVLKPYTYISLLDAADWLKFPKPEVINAQGATQATLTIRDLTFTANRVMGADGNSLAVRLKATTPAAKATLTTQGLKVDAKLGGPTGNGISIEFTSGGTAGSEVVTVTGQAISVQIEDSVSTLAQVITALGLASPAVALATFTQIGLPTDPMTAAAPLSLTGGAVGDPATAGAELASLNGNTVEVLIADGVSTADQIKAALDANDTIKNLLTTTVSGTGANPQGIAGPTSLAGGVNAPGFDGRLYRSLTDIINGACDKVEAIISGPVLTRDFVEEHDGSESNVFKPHHWPVRAVKELKIDYNRAFGPTSIVPPGQYFLRGGSDVKQTKGDVDIRVIGSDVVLRDDNENFILGRIFSGSVLGSIKVTYAAGWGATSDDLPQDIVLATKQLMEFWYFMRENRDIGVQSKGVKGESYSKMKDGIPEEILELLSQYEDTSLGTRPVPQRNYFRV